MEPFLGGILLGGFLAFNAFATPNRVEKTAEKALRQKFPGATVDVEIKGKRGADVLKGRFQSVQVDLSNVRFDDFPIQSTASSSASAPGTPGVPAKEVKTAFIGHLELRLRDLTFDQLRVKSATLSFDNVRYDFNALKKRSEIRLISFSNGRIALAVESPALLPTFAARAPDISNPQIGLRGGEAILSGNRTVLGTKANVVVRGPIVARGQNLELDQPRVEVAGVSLAPKLAAPFLPDLNPLYAFDPEGKWPFKLQIQSIRAEDDALQLEGALSMK